MTRLLVLGGSGDESKYGSNEMLGDEFVGGGGGNSSLHSNFSSS